MLLKGIKVKKIQKGSEAERSGLREGDVIIKYDDLFIQDDYSYLQTLCNTNKEKNENEIELIRNNENVFFHVKGGDLGISLFEVVELSSSTDQPDNSQNKIIVGIILFVIGLVAIIMRFEITLKIVGRSGVLRDAISMSGGKAETTLIVITIIGILTMILGLIILFNAILETINKNKN